jgi:hypothetical protein
MYIANPIYDVVFKFMMEDDKVAKKFISTIIGEQIHDLELAPQEITVPIPEKKEGSIRNTVCRLDFLARVDTDEGRRTVIIEVQKSKTPSDIVRFRRYLGAQYQSESNYYREKDKTVARQIYCIYFLGERLKCKGLPVVEVFPQTRNRLTKENLPDMWEDEEMVYALHHRSWIVQIPELSKNCSDEVEILLSIFDQNRRLSYDHHILNVPEKDFPDDVRPMIRRLQQATENPEIKNQMIAEDEYVEYFRITERTIEDQKKTIVKHKQTIEEHKQTIEAHRQTIGELKRMAEEQTQTLEEMKRMFEKKDSEFAEIKQLLLLNLRNSNTEN